MDLRERERNPRCERGILISRCDSEELELIWNTYQIDLQKFPYSLMIRGEKGGEKRN